MLKVVGASWVQTRISGCIIAGVGLLGIGILLISVFSRGRNDGMYSATVFWNDKGGYYRIDFWGQGNDLVSLPKGAARAYYRPRIQDTGWSIVEIETSSSYPDAVQAYAAGLLEGSLTWQLIHHHWYNTIGAICSLEENEQQCFVTRQQLRLNAAFVRERAELLAAEDPFWHMVRLFYAQLEGMEAGWRFAVRRSRRSVDILSEDFLWLAMASEIKNEIFKSPFDAESPRSSDVESQKSSNASNNGVIFVKSLDRSMEGLAPLIAFAQNTVASYSKMLRLLKRYTFGFHLSENKHAPRAPTRSIVMSSYPGAMSSHDEYYVVQGGDDNDDVFILASVPLQNSSETIFSTPLSSSDSKQQKKYKGNGKEEERISRIRRVMSPVRIMSANRLATETRTWSQFMGRGNPSNNAQNSIASSQWVTLTPKDSSIWLIEQQSSTLRAFNLTQNFLENGYIFCNGESVSKESFALEQLNNDGNNNSNSYQPEDDFHLLLSENITNVEAIRNLMSGPARYLDNKFDEEVKNISSVIMNFNEKIESPSQSFLEASAKFIFRGDLENPPKPIGTIDNKMTLVTANGVESFEATCGPPYGQEIGGSPVTPFDWTESFQNLKRIGQPDIFKFESVIPQWIWF